MLFRSNNANPIIEMAKIFLDKINNINDDKIYDILEKLANSVCDNSNNTKSILNDNRTLTLNASNVNSHNINSNNVNNNQTNYNINVPAFINPFGYETISHLSHDEMLEIITSPNAIEMVIDRIYSVPENRNFIRPNANKDFINILNSELDISNRNIGQFCEQLPSNCIHLLERMFHSIHTKLCFKDKQAIQANIMRQKENLGLENSIMSLRNLIENYLQNKIGRAHV